jgi:pimeloyl-ACP methyl ester carboxylesterase
MRTRLGILTMATTVVLTLTTALPAAAAATPHPTARSAGPLASFYDQRVAWAPCTDTEGSECATVVVPLDYRKPQGVTITLGLLRKPPVAPDAPPLIFNPGGPGASATAWVDAAGSLLVNPASPDITARYSLVGLDPRGVGRSTQLNCMSAKALQAQTADLPQTAAEQLAYAADATLNEVCDKTNKGLTSNIGTDSAARDLDIVRAALGQERLNFYGASYGSYLGMMYAHTFPDRVGRMVLDGINGPFDDMSGLALAQARGSEESLRGWAATCAARGPQCPAAGIATTRQGVLGWLRNLLNVVHRKPLQPSIGGEIKDRAILDIALGMLSDGQGAGFDSLDAMLGAVATAVAGGPGADDAADLVNDARVTYTLATPNYLSVNQAVNCYDRPTTGTRATTKRHTLAWRKLAPFFSAIFAPIPSACFHWPVRGSKANLPVLPTTDAPVLLINGLHDPRTPVRMARQSVRLFPNASLLLWNGFGHVSGTRGNSCINDAVAGYLTDGTLPSAGIVCPS